MFAIMARMFGSVSRNWFDRTFKREVAIALMWFWGALTVKLFFYSTIELIGALNQIYATVTTFVGTFALASFGFDAVQKQWGNGDGVQKS